MASSSRPPSSVTAPEHLSSSECAIKAVPGKGRRVYAERFIPRGTLVDINPVLLEINEHENHDHPTFVWPGNRTALDPGLGSLFSYSDPPNVVFTLDPSTESITYTTAQDIQPGEELCIDGNSLTVLNPFASGDSDEALQDDVLPFRRFRPPPEEETAESIRTVEAWVVDVPEPRHLATLIKWLKQANLESPDVAHLKRIRKNLDTGETSLLLSMDIDKPPLPEILNLPEPYRVPVPASSALTMTSLALKTAIWPTMYTPKRKDEPEPWTRGQVRWAWDAMLAAVNEARKAGTSGEKPIAANIAVPYETTDSTESISFTAHDTRTSTKHPLKHAAINAIRKLADYHASHHESSLPEPNPEQDREPGQNGSNYLLTGQTVFLTHEPCIMCSMALLHSRVKEVFYLYSMPHTGGCGSLACLPTLKGVNHRFSICHWEDRRGLGVPDQSENSHSHGLHVGTEVDA